MNYRINPAALDPDKAKSLIKNGRYEDVLKFDQLRDQMQEGKVFHGFTEGPITFRPTYKYDVNSDNWDSSEKNRSPAWCDRVLWKGDNISQIDYVSVGQYKLSDHKPVASLFEAKVNALETHKMKVSV
jgi:phosphatidylinositol-bisphosphatase